MTISKSCARELHNSTNLSTRIKVLKAIIRKKKLEIKHLKLFTPSKAKGDKMKIDGDAVVFSTGKKVYVNNGIIGLSEPDEDGWSVSEGYDGGINTNKLTHEERWELADYMINLWKRFKIEA